ncbi:extracellular solute-binding protein [uncultured Tateyamaria sp.]|uniref:extracellular solute-binding protein n=1 Tax=uncultured Tateyamaria sp. TaxID=455651 RepID=UPI0026027E3D|nr:extracellular solute-binding protein [uncultured Tateyamaria sp.]
MRPTRSKDQAEARVIAARNRYMTWAALGVLGLIVTLALSTIARAAEHENIITSHGYSFYGELTYPEDYPHFDYVNPDAPKGGEIALGTVGTFDSVNPYSRKGRAAGLSSIMYENLFAEGINAAALPADTYAEYYCLLCERLEYDEGKNWVIFHMRPEARFSDGSPVTAHDIAFSHNLLLDQGLKSYADAVRKRIPNVEVLDDYRVKFYFTPGISRRSLISQVGNVPAWSKKWYEENDARLDEQRLTTSPGSGPYMIDSVDVNRRIVYKRNPDYWGKDLPVNKGRANFDKIRLEYFGDAEALFQGFLAGAYTIRSEGDSKKWSTGYNAPKVQNGSIVTKELPDGNPPVPTGMVYNLDSPVFADRRVREAIALGYNFEWTNASLQFGLFSQRKSFSEGTEVMATGTPEGAELAFLKGLGDIVPDALFNEDVRVPHTSNEARLFDRRNARKAMALLDEAGWTVGDDGMRRNADGQVLTVKFLTASTSSDTLTGVIENFASNVRKLGVDLRIEEVDSSQYTARRRDRDYDMIFFQYAAFQGTGTGLAQYYGSETSAFSLFNPAGLASPLVDAIIEASLLVETREEEVASVMALDRALRHELIMIPVWYNPNHWVAYYDMFEYPDPLPPFALGRLDFWWHNAEKEAELRASGALR